MREHIINTTNELLAKTAAAEKELTADSSEEPGGQPLAGKTKLHSKGQAIVKAADLLREY